MQITRAHDCNYSNLVIYEDVQGEPAVGGVGLYAIGDGGRQPHHPTTFTNLHVGQGIDTRGWVM